MTVMGKRIPAGSWVLTIFVLTSLFSLKLHYSTASVNELDWILFPTARLVEGVTGIPFQKETCTGYVNWQAQVIIAKSCAGVNFMIVLMLMFSMMSMKHKDSLKKKWLSIPVLMILSYAITVTANSIRIIISIYSFRLDIFTGWLTRERFHHISGTIIFFVFLSVTHHISMGIFKKKPTPRYLMPLFCYMIITIGIPLIRSPLLYSSSFFIEHSMIILLVSMIVLTFKLGVVKIFSGAKCETENTDH